METRKDLWQSSKLSRRSHTNPATCHFHIIRSRVLKCTFLTCAKAMLAIQAATLGLHFIPNTPFSWETQMTLYTYDMALIWPRSSACREQRHDIYLELTVKVGPFSAFEYDQTADTCLFPFLYRQLKLCTSGWIHLETLINQQETPCAGFLHLCCRTHVVCSSCTSWKRHWADPRYMSLVMRGVWGADLQTTLFLEPKQSSDLMEIN